MAIRVAIVNMLEWCTDRKYIGVYSSKVWRNDNAVP